MIESAPVHLRPIIITALETGGRLSEILGLRWEDADLGRGLLYFSQTNTKSMKQREIPLTPTLADTLRERSKVLFGTMSAAERAMIIVFLRSL